MTLEYSDLKNRLACGWNTWNTRSVLSHVLLPQGLAINLGLKEFAGGQHMDRALIGETEHIVRPGLRTYDGGYTELNVDWRFIEIKVESATVGGDLVLLVTPIANPQKTPPLLIAQVGMLWNRDGSVYRRGDGIIGHLPGGEVPVYGTRESIAEPYVDSLSPYLSIPLDRPVGISTGKRRSIDEIHTIVTDARANLQEYIASFGELVEVYTPVQTCMAWDTVYDPLHDRVISPVSRIWNCAGGGYVLFCWDTYFAAAMAAIDNKDLAYANAIEITREKTEKGFVPNFATPQDVKSRDRSQPPVGSMMIYNLYKKYGDEWLLQEVFEDLLDWNRWWPASRASKNGLLCWGSDPFEPVRGAPFEIGINDRQAAAYESGLDNSPMYDDIPFDSETHIMGLEDAGLNGLYVGDCRALTQIAEILGRNAEAAELRNRGDEFAAKLQSLWDEKTGIFLNRRTDTGEFSHRISPTNFYPLIGDAATEEQAARMIDEHFNNPKEFAGEYIIPSISRDDPAYGDQDYWRGRIWAPMNFLVYLGLRNYDLPQARAAMTEKSRKLLCEEWNEHGHVHENYNGTTGEGCDVTSSDRFYHWGGLLGLISFFEKGYFG